MHHRLPTFPRACRRAGAVSGVARSAHRRGPARPRHRAALQSSGPRVGARRAGQERRRGHADRFRQDALLQPAGAAVAGRAAGGAHPLPVPDQGAGPGSAVRAGGRWPSRCPRCACSPTTATRRRTRGAPCGRAPTSSSPTPTCCTRASCRTTRSGRASSRTSASSSSTSSTPTAACSARTWPTCCAGSSASARHYGSTPQFIMASATIGNPGELAQPGHRRAGGGDHRERRAHRREDVRLLQPAGGQPRAGHPGAVSR